MAGNTPRGIVMGVALLTAQILGCSDDDEEQAKTTGSCESIATFQVCNDFTADAETIADEREFCEGDSEYIWRDAPCPTTDLIGCCYDDFAGDEYRECYYTGYSEPATELEQACMDFDAEWRPGSR
jgi:hypothetical protein